MRIYHIAEEFAWKTALEEGIYKPEGFAADGFVHCSTKSQLPGVVLHYYSNRKKLLLLAIETDKLVSDVKYENLEGGEELFPHVYGLLNLESIVKVSIFSSVPGEFFPEILV